MMTMTVSGIGNLGIINGRAAAQSIRRQQMSDAQLNAMTQSESRALTLKIFGYTTLALVLGGGATVGFLVLREKMRGGLRDGRPIRTSARPPGVPLPKGSKRRW